MYSNVETYLQMKSTTLVDISIKSHPNGQALCHRSGHVPLPGCRYIFVEVGQNLESCNLEALCRGTPVKGLHPIRREVQWSTSKWWPGTIAHPVLSITMPLAGHMETGVWRTKC